jgi:hypothetical protein
MKRFLPLLAALLLLVACGGKEVRQPPEEALVAKEAIAVAEDLRNAYVHRNFQAMRRYATEEAYSDIIRNIKKFRSVELEFTPRWVEVNQDATEVTLNVSWSGTWTLDGKKESLKGMAVFSLTGKPLKLAGVLRGSPFVEPRTSPESP